MPIVSFAPGFVLVRRMRRWSALEKFTASIAASIVLIYLAAFFIYNTVISWRLAWVYTAIAVIALGFSWKDARRLFTVPQVRRVAVLFGALYLWNLLMLAVIRHNGGGYWGPDWYEHYERTMFFLERGWDQQLFIDLYLLPARPPLMNLYSAFFMAQAGAQFANYQLTFAFLNLLPFVPLVLLSQLLVRHGTRWAGLLATVLACNPMFMHNAQFSWTKAAVGFFVALGIWFYLVAWRRQDSVRMSLAFVSLSAGTLVHYSGGPYAVVLGLHYLVGVFWSRRSKMKEVMGIALPSAALLATWFVYSVSAYGAQVTFASNTTVTESRRMDLSQNVSKIGLNIVDTLVPPMARGYWADRTDDSFRRVVDNAFHWYQINLPFAFGVAGSFLVLFLLIRALAGRYGGRAARERIFWLVFVLLAVTLNIAVIGPRDYFGVTHIGLQPLVHVGIAFLAASLPALPRTLRGAMLAGMAIDFVLGIAIHVFMEASVAEWAVDYNLELKNKVGLIFLGDWFADVGLPLQWVLWALFAALIVRGYRLLDRLPDVDAWTGKPRINPAISETSGPSFS